MKKFVYLAGPIEGCDLNEITYWRKLCHQGFSDFIIGVNPFRAEMDADTKESRKRIVMKNYMDTKNCDLIFAYLPKEINERRPSYGTTFEIAWGYSMQKPVVIVSNDKQVHNHPLMDMSGALFWNLEEAIDYVNILLGEYERNKYDRYVN
jgi:nucleoside 2-deoxyribosyltransferase|tara:strand:+ start:169 stop:618 length:450 start_codon:yes stop_codon:yes gene_type:complete